MIFIFLSIIFWSFFEQSGGSLSLYAEKLISKDMLGLNFDPNVVNNSANSGRHLVEVMAYAEAPSAKTVVPETVEQAVWMMMASTVMNCDDAINK